MAVHILAFLRISFSRCLNLVLLTVCMLSAMAAWNEYAVALVMVTDPKKQTLTVGLAALYEIQRYATDWGSTICGIGYRLNSDNNYLRYRTKISDTGNKCWWCKRLMNMF